MRRAPASCELGADGVPSCGTGPAGRLAWAYTELRDIWRERRRRRLGPTGSRAREGRP